MLYVIWSIAGLCWRIDMIISSVHKVTYITKLMSSCLPKLITWINKVPEITWIKRTTADQFVEIMKNQYFNIECQ